MPPTNQTQNQAPAAPVFGSQTPKGSNNEIKATQKPRNPNSTQNTLLLSEVRDNMVVMADGSFRAVIACKSINFDLMSSREREGIEYSYQNFLNSLNNPIQILIRSQRVDIGPYLDKMMAIRQNQDNMLLGVLMDDYINFIDMLSQEANIMDKSFYITVPYFIQGDASNIVEQSKGFFGRLFNSNKNTVTKIDTATYEKAKTEIRNRVDNVVAGLYQLGVQSRQLTTKELGELYYNFYNPDTAVREQLVDFTAVTSTFVRKGDNQTGGPN